jgi:hypothetical protein
LHTISATGQPNHLEDVVIPENDPSKSKHKNAGFFVLFIKKFVL